MSTTGSHVHHKSEAGEEAQDEAGQQKEGEPERHEHSDHNEHSEHGGQSGHGGGHGGHGGHGSGDHHAHMLQDFKNRFIVSAILTIPILFLSPLIQEFFSYTFRFAGDSYVVFALSTVVFFYGGYPFLKGIVDELRKKNPGMMTLIAVAIIVAYVYRPTGQHSFSPSLSSQWELLPC